VATVVSVVVATLQWVVLRDSADLTRRALESTERAFVYIDKFEAEVVGDSLRVMPKWGNSGNTPTKGMINYVSWQTFPLSGPPIVFGYPDIGPDGHPTDQPVTAPLLIGPKASIYGPFFDIPLRFVTDAKYNTVMILIWGWTEYWDVFPGTKRHWTQFCNRIVVTGMGKKGDATTAAVVFSLYGPHNRSDADEQ
jgi:hypothetical protein